MIVNTRKFHFVFLGGGGGGFFKLGTFVSLSPILTVLDGGDLDGGGGFFLFFSPIIQLVFNIVVAFYVNF